MLIPDSRLQICGLKHIKKNKWTVDTSTAETISQLINWLIDRTILMIFSAFSFNSYVSHNFEVWTFVGQNQHCVGVTGSA